MPNPPSDLDWSVKTWMYQYENYPRGLPPGADEAKNIGLRFIDKNVSGGWFSNVFGAVIRRDPFDPNAIRGGGAPAFCVSDHLLVRRDFYTRGKMTSLEGIIVLHSNGPGAIPPNDKLGIPGSDNWHIGWGPRNTTVNGVAQGSPFIWLAQGGDGPSKIIGYDANNDPIYSWPYKNPYNPEEEYELYKNWNRNASTLILAVTKEVPNESANLDKYWDFGHFEAEDIISHGDVQTSHLIASSTSTQNIIAVHSNLVPFNRAQKPDKQTDSYDLGSSDYPWENLYVKNINNDGVQAGNDASDFTTGLCTVWFKKSFKNPPAVNVTVFDVTGRHLIPILVDVKTDRFTVKIVRKFTIRHHHITGYVGTVSNWNYGAPSLYRSLSFESSGAVGALMCTASDGAKQLLTSEHDPDAGSNTPGGPTKDEDVYEVPMGADFHWIAIAKTQNPGYHP